VAALRVAAEERARRAELDGVRAAEQGKRRRVLLAAGAASVVVLLVGLSVSLWQTWRAIQALEAEQQARQDETKAREQAFDALRTMTTEVVERKFAEEVELAEDDRAFLRGVIAQYDAFAAIKGDDADSRAVRAEGRLRVGTMRYRLGELDEAEQDYDQAVGMYEQLAAEFPSRYEFRQDLANTRNNRGHLLLALGRPEEARQDYDQAVDTYARLVDELPSRPELRQDLAGSHSNRGILLSGVGRLPEAREDYDQALGIREQLVAEFPSRPELREDLATSHNSRGVLLRSIGRLEEAEQDYDQALVIREQLAAESPSQPELRQQLATSHNNRGVLLREAGRLEEAQEDCDQALGIYKQLAAEFPARPEFRQQLATSHTNRAHVLYGRGFLEEAEKDYDQALDIRRQLAADFPDQPDLRNQQAVACVNLAAVHQQRGDWAVAKQLLLDGRPHHLAALEASPDNPSYRQGYRSHLMVLTAAYAGLLEPEDALRTAETCRDLGWDAPRNAYDAACFLSLCIPIVAKHDQLDATQREEAVELYGDAAMRLLHDAASKGFKAVTYMQEDTDLAPLRQRDDFRELAAELEGREK
jgi:tetratricopeptide (TPR) repeat protein